MAGQHSLLREGLGVLGLGVALVACNIVGNATGGAGTDSPPVATGGRGPDSLSFDEGNVHYEKRCAETASSACERLCDECWNSWDSSSYDIATGFVSTCSSICDCSGSSDTCVEWEHSFDFGPVQQDIYAACDAARSHIAEHRCVSAEHVDCYAAAAAERPEVALAYWCIAESASEGMCSAEDCNLPEPGTFGTGLCSATADKCGTCSLDPDRLNDRTHWWRDDVREAATRCLEYESCLDVEGCHQAWADGVGLLPTQGFAVTGGNGNDWVAATGGALPAVARGKPRDLRTSLGGVGHV